jgi:hypothetical protein
VCRFFQLFELRFQNMEPCSEILPVPRTLLPITLQTPTHVQDIYDEPYGKNDYDGKQGQPDEDGKVFHDGVRAMQLCGIRSRWAGSILIQGRWLATESTVPASPARRFPGC